MFAALNTVEPPILELVTAKILEGDKPWSEERLPLVEDRIRDRMVQLSARLGDADWLDGAASSHGTPWAATTAAIAVGERVIPAASSSSAASEPLAEEGVEHEWSSVVVASDIALVDEQAFERVLQRAACDSVFVGDSAAGGCLAVGEREQHDSLDSAEPIPRSLMSIAGLGEREIDGGCREILRLAGLVEQVVDVVGEQDRALWVSAGESEQLVDCTAGIQTVGCH
jgi:hypothetical protein